VVIRIGIVGAARILPAHLRGYQRLREAGYHDFRITGIMSRNRADAEMFRKRGEGPEPRPPVSKAPGDPLSAPHVYVSDFQDDVEAKVYDSLEQMLDDGQVDALDIPATLSIHHTATIAGLEAGKHCLVQKPFAISVKAGRMMVDEARKRGLSLGVVENVRYAEGTRIARWAIDQGMLGDVQMAAWWDIGTAEWSPDKIVAETPWRHKKLIGGAGSSLDIGVHWFDRLRHLAGEIDEISAVTRVFEKKRYTRDANGNVTQEVDCDVDDAFFASMQFANGAIGQMSFTWAGHGEMTNLPQGLLLYGSKGVIKGDRLVLDRGNEHSLKALFEEKADAALKERYFPYGLRDTFAIGALDFLRGIGEGRDPETSGDEGVRDLAASYAICESAELGRPVKLQDVYDGKVDAYQAEINQHYGL
jgi:1,5-anhydro-D-fructose reductase (1,5-anhydro-D-mannitol-forming)